MSKSREELLRELEEESRKSTLDGVYLLQAVAERSGMNLTDLQCIAILTSTGPVPAGQLAETMGLTTGAVTGVINRMERAGYVRREKDRSDGRRVVVRPVLEELERAGAGFFGSPGGELDALMSEYDDRDLAVFLDFMRKANAATREEISRIRAASEGSRWRRAHRSPGLGGERAAGIRQRCLPAYPPRRFRGGRPLPGQLRGIRTEGRSGRRDRDLPLYPALWRTTRLAQPTREGHAEPCGALGDRDARWGIRDQGGLQRIESVLLRY